MVPISAGRVVAGRYLLKRELARGCMGAVWVGLDQRLQRPVAVKLMKLQWAGQDEARVRFEREAMAVAQLRSPHIVQIFDYGIDHDVPFIVMEMLDGYDLHAQLKRLKRLSLEQTVQLVAQAAKGLGAAHEVNIVHRDLKPANLFIVRTGEDELLKILDFGVAKADVDVDRDEDGEEVTKVGMVLGTPQYMAPEQARGLAEIDHRADLWSLGIIAYRCLTGRLPFTGKNVTEVIVGMLTKPAAPPSGLAPHLPPGIDEFFARALATDPNHRFASAREMAAALTSLAAGSLAAVSLAQPSVAGAGAPPSDLSQPGMPGAPVPPAEPSLDSSWGEWDTPPPSLPGSGTSPGTMDTFPSGAQWVAIPDPDTLGEAEQTGAPTDTGATPVPAEALAALQAQQLGEEPKRWAQALKLAALSFVALVLGGGLVFVLLSHDEPPTAEAADPQATPEVSSAAAEMPANTPEVDDPPPVSAAPSATATTSASAAPAVEPSAKSKTKPKPKPRPKPKPKPKPKPAEPDPFSERL